MHQFVSSILPLSLGNPRVQSDVKTRAFVSRSVTSSLPTLNTEVHAIKSSGPNSGTRLPARIRRRLHPPGEMSAVSMRPATQCEMDAIGLVSIHGEQLAASEDSEEVATHKAYPLARHEPPEQHLRVSSFESVHDP
ncbi:hypothetical protein PSTT_04160 [Puccinia striiformis]|uniref:Uncharacterized protein n=1 Tax=Puccinia striiformis TaxID=27350 RepID=A0A2S4VTQ8_9BASI|nr:hypothetical protein PSTT_04160 [Puccinia striiformis]